ncbi:MAG TPA: hypothetical protein VF454_01905 [Gemmatimonadales bacterium]
MPRRPLVVAATLSLLLLIAHLGFHTPALSDPTGAALPEGVRLAFPTLNLLLAPLFDLWDGVTLLTLPQLNAFLLGALTLGAAWSIGSSIRDRRLRWGRATARLALFVVGLGLFVLGGITWRRPMAHIAGVPDSFMVVDLHSHTNVSHDVKGRLQGDFDLEASRRWHARGGFDAFFVTDHNRIDGWQGRIDTLAPEVFPVACPGEELSLYRAHIVVLGNWDSIPRSAYADSTAGIARMLGESERRWRGLTLASIPEYNDNHFADLPQWIADGLDGFEVSNAAPKANRQSRIQRDSVIALARANGRWLAGVSDQHGLGATVQAWTLVRAYESPEDFCTIALSTLRTGGFAATQVLERHRLRIDSPWPVFATVIGVPWEGWRAAGMWQVVSWLAWIWALALVAAWRSWKGLA